MFSFNPPAASTVIATAIAPSPASIQSFRLNVPSPLKTIVRNVPQDAPSALRLPQDGRGANLAGEIYACLEEGEALAVIRVTLVLEPQPEGGYTVTCPYLPELVTEGDTQDEALANAYDALTAVLELYAEAGRRR